MACTHLSFKLAPQTQISTYIFQALDYSLPAKGIGGAMYLNKVLTTFSPQTITPPILTAKGGKIVRYVDSADSTRKDAVTNNLE